MVDVARLKPRIMTALKKTGVFLLSFFFTSLLFQSIAFYFLFEEHYFEKALDYWLGALFNEFLFTSLLGGFVMPWLMFQARWIIILMHVILCLLLVFQVTSVFYFIITLEPIGATMMAFDADQMELIASSFVVFQWNYLIIIFVPLVYGLVYRFLSPSLLFKRLSFIFFIPFLLMPFVGIQKNQAGTFGSGGLVLNKTIYFLESWIERSLYLNMSSYEHAVDHYQALEDRKFTDRNYPFLHKPSTSNTLAPFFNLGETPPNVVLIIVESLSSSYSGKNADELSFTPFLDSLAGHSVYFENMLATGERTFSVLPSIISSLPHGKKGFTATKNTFPEHSSLSTWLFENKYSGAFYYGGYSRFDYMDLYMTHEGFHSIYDREEYNYEGTGLNTTFDPVPFGIGDRELMERVLKTTDSLNRKSPYLDVILTLSMHYPYLIDRKDYYMELAKTKIAHAKKLSSSDKKKCNKYLEPFSTMLYTDDVLKYYFEQQAKVPSHNNTIYVIIGDHMMTDIPHDSPIEKYRVPMLIYSPLLARTKRIEAVNSQLDIAPSLMQLICEVYGFEMPEKVSWLGHNLDTSSVFGNTRNILFMRNKRVCEDYISGDYFVHLNELYKIDRRLKLIQVDEKDVLAQLKSSRSFYEKLHSETVIRNKLIPPANRGSVISERKSTILSFSDSEEYITVMKQVFSTDYKKIQMKLQLSLEEGWKPVEKDKAPMLICSISRNGEESYFWEQIDLELIKTSLSEDRHIVLNIEENRNLSLRKGDEITLMIWNLHKENRAYKLLLKQLQLKGEKN